MMTSSLRFRRNQFAGSSWACEDQLFHEKVMYRPFVQTISYTFDSTVHSPQFTILPSIFPTPRRNLTKLLVLTGRGETSGGFSALMADSDS